MKYSNTHFPFQARFNRCAPELKYALKALRDAKSKLDFELARFHLLLIIEEISGA